MEKEIIWTKRALKDLRKVYDFNIELKGEEKAFALVEQIITRVETLTDQRFSSIGAIDESFKHLKHRYRKLIEGEIKITYREAINNPIIYINRIFDTRQHPAKNK